ncbi:MAG: hypothetical protein R3199_00745 [Gemmatimonadota bacterium]|nr:hypothetical protein [Gemmatimonadota bacterium]
MSEKRVFGAFLVAAGAATLLFFGSFVADREAMLFGTDMVSEAYQSRAFAVQEVAAGRGLPEWNPYVYGGMPYLSILPYPVWYPTSLAYFVMPLHRAIGWAFVLHFLLAGLLAYALARELDLAPGAAIVVGAGYMFTGYIVSHLYAGQDGRMFAMQWAPALFLLAERAISRRSLHWFGWLAAVVVLQLFTPHVQMTYFAAMALGAWVAFRLVQVRREERAWGPPLRLLGGFVGAYAVAGLVALVEIWPTMNMVEFSHRAARDYAYASSWSMPAQETLAAMWPEFQGILERYWGTNPFKLHTEYLGAVPVLLAALALAARRTARVWFFAGLGVVALLFAWGAATPIHRIAYEVLPFVKQFRAPSMMYSIVALAVVVLAGHGAQALHDRRKELADAGHPAWKILGGLAIAWIVTWFWAAGAPDSFARFWSNLLYGSIGPDRLEGVRRAMPGFARGLGLFTLYWGIGVAVCWAAVRGVLAPLAACAVLAVVTVADLWRVNRKFYDTIPVAEVARPDPAVEFLREEPGPFRALPLPGTYGPNDLMLFRVPSVTGSQKFRLRWWDDLVGEQMERLSDTRLWALLDLRYLVSSRPIELEGLRPAFEGGGKIVYRWTGPARGAWVVHDVRVRPADADPAEALGRIDPATTALLEPGADPPPLGAAEGRARIEWVERVPDRLELEVENPADGLLVLSEIHHPYWSARVDGEPVEVMRVDVALRGVPLPAGSHRVELVFDDPYVEYGGWGSLAGVVLLAAALALTWRGRGGREAEGS